jgi:hypothetical protein
MEPMTYKKNRLDSGLYLYVTRNYISVALPEQQHSFFCINFSALNDSKCNFFYALVNLAASGWMPQPW